MAKLILVLVLGLFALINTVNGECKKCTDTNYAACFNATAFYICLDGKNPSTQIGVCNPGEVCTTEAGVCKVGGATVTADCKNECGTCKGAFACVSKTEFVTCDAAGKPGTSVISCPENQYCNIDSFVNTKAICIKTCDNTPTCSNDVVEKPDPSEGLADSCTDPKVPGAYPNKKDPSCKTYVFCQELGGTLYSILYTCSSGYFSKEEKTCIAAKPSYCT